MRGLSVRGALPIILPLAIATSGLIAPGLPAVAAVGPGDVLTYRGDPARTGVMPGPGPSGVPAVAWTFQPGAPIASQVATAGDVVFLVTAVGSVHALEMTTGTELWRADAGAPSRAGPSVSSGLVIVATADGIDAFDADDGSLAWSSGASDAVAGTPAVLDGVVLAASEGGAAWALDADSGRTLWQADVGLAAVNSVAADAGSGMGVVAGREGVAVAVDLADGSIVWRYDTHDHARIGTPTIGDGLVYFATLEGGGPGTRRIHAVDAATGQRVWALASSGDAPALPPALAEGRAIISGEDGSVTAVDARSGDKLWRYDAPGVVETVPAVTGDSVYVASNDGQALALDVATGAELWRVPIEGIPFGVAVTGGLVLVGTTTGTLYAIGGSAA